MRIIWITIAEALCSFLWDHRPVEKKIMHVLNNLGDKKHLHSVISACLENHLM